MHGGTRKNVGLAHVIAAAMLAASPALAQKSTTVYFYNSTFDVTREYTYDAANSQTFNNTLYAYDELGRVTATVSASSSSRSSYVPNSGDHVTDDVTLTVYNSGGYVVKSVRKGAGNEDHDIETGDSVAVYDYDTLGRCTKTTLPDSGESLVEYDRASNVTKSRRLLHGGTYADTLSEYDEAGRCTKVTDPDSQVHLYTYLTGGSLQRIESKSGTTTLARSQFAYDTAARLTRTVQFADAGGSWTEDINIDDVTDLIYDSGGRLSTRRSFLYDGSSTSTVLYAYAYDAIGRLTQTAAPQGVSATMTPDATWKMLPQKTVYADGHATNMEVDNAYNNLLPVRTAVTIGGTGTSLVDPLTWSMAYNGLRQVIRTTDPASHCDDRDHDIHGQERMRTEDAASGGMARETGAEHDRSSRLASQVAYDPAGDEQTTSYTYDPMDRVVNVDYPDADSASAEYDYAGRLTLRTLQNGRHIEYGYDARGNLVTKTLHDEYRHVYEYDGLSRVTLARRENIAAAPDEVVAETTFVYDGLSRVTQETQKLFGETTGKTLLYNYDQRGNRVSLQYSAGNVDSIHLKYQYDLLNHNTLVQAKFNTRRSPNRSGYIDLIKYVYSGNLLRTRQVRSLYNDEAPYVNKELELVTEYSYDVHRRVTTIDNRTTWDGAFLDRLAKYEYTFDVLSNMTYAAADFSTSPSVGYSRVQQRDGLEYDRVNRLTLLEGQDEHEGACYREEFSYDYLGNVDDGHHYGGSGCGSDSPYAFDSNIANEYEAWEHDGDTFTLGYDDVGNMTRRDTDNAGDHQAYTYYYDDEDRLIRIEFGEPGEGGDLVARFEYDALGRMVWSDVVYDSNGGSSDEAETYYYHDGDEVIAEYDPTDDPPLLRRRFIHGTSRIDERAVLIEGHLGDPNPVAGNATAEGYYYLLQELDSVPALMRQNGALGEANVYSAYGRVRTFGYPVCDINRDGVVTNADYALFGLPGTSGSPTNDPTMDYDFDGDRDYGDWYALHHYSGCDADTADPVSCIGNPYAFTGRRLVRYESLPDDDDSQLSNEQLQFNRARWLDHATSRWLQRDPKGYADGMSLYEYCKSNPTKYTDPEGTESFGETDEPGSGAKEVQTILDEIARTKMDYEDAVSRAKRGIKRSSGSNNPFTVIDEWLSGVSFNPEYELNERTRSARTARDRALLSLYARLEDANKKIPFDPFNDELCGLQSEVDMAIMEGRFTYGRARLGKVAVTTAATTVVVAQVVTMAASTPIAVVGRGAQGGAGSAAGEQLLFSFMKEQAVADVEGEPLLLRCAKNSLESRAAARGGIYDVGEYGTLRDIAEPGLHAHHVGQKALMQQFISGYDPEVGPSILVPRVGHTVRDLELGIVSRSTRGFGNARQVIARDILELRRVYPDVQNPQLQKLIELNKLKYPEVGIRGGAQ